MRVLTLTLLFLLAACAEPDSPTQPVDAGQQQSSSGVFEDVTTARSQAPAEPQNLRPIFDSRLNLQPGQVTAAERRILESRVRPAAFRNWSSAPCYSENEFRIVDVTQGSFTSPGRSQRAALYSLCEQSRASSRIGFAIFENGSLVDQIDFEGGGVYAIGAMPDLNQDGVDELLLSGGFTGQGITEGGGSIYQINDGRLQQMANFGTSESGESYVGGEPRSVSRYTKTFVSKGPQPRFYQEAYEEDARGGWRLIEDRHEIPARR